MKEYKSTGIAGFLSGKGFYIVLSACLVAVGVAAWSAVTAFTEYQNTENLPEYSDESPSYIDNSVTSTPDEQQSEAPVQNELQDVEYPEQSAPAEEPTQQITADYFIMPVEGNISKTFSDSTLQYSATFSDMRLHTGIDIICDTGSDIKSAGNGTVTEIYNDASLGKTIVIDHGNGIVAKYCGLADEVYVSSGDTVNAGSKIGTLGNIPSESADMPHLHFEMFKDSKTVAPLEIMGKTE